MVSVNTEKVKSFIEQNKQVVALMATALLLTIALLIVRAGGPFASFETEGGVLGGNATIKNDGGASGEQYVEFGGAGTGGDADFTIAIETPAPDTSYASGSSLAIGAKLSSDAPDGVRVVFYQNGIKFDERPRVPYLGVLEKPQNGTYDLTAVAIDAQGKQAVSQAVRVKVQTGVDSCSGTRVSPGGNIQQAVNSASAGTVCLESGRHFLSTALSVPNGTSIVGLSGARVSGGKQITNWQFDSASGLWKATGQTQQSAESAQFGCEDGYPRCGFNEDLFINNARQRHVAQKSDVVSGTYFFDYNADTIWIKDDPAGKSVFNAVLARFISGSPSNVTVQGLVLEHFASPFQDAPVDLGSGGKLLGNETAYNHARGFKFSSNGQAIGNYTHDNGMQGYNCGGSNLLAASNTLIGNGGNQFAGGSLGGVKCSVTNGLTVRGTISRSNIGDGLWTDIENINTLYEYNLVEDNSKSGIFHEISYGAEIRYNIARRNGHAHWFDKAHGGIFLNGSENVKIHHNEVESNHVTLGMIEQQRVRSGTTYFLRNNQVYENTAFVDSGHVGVYTTVANPVSWLNSSGIIYRDNTYYLKGVNDDYFLWDNNYQNQTAWRNNGNDTSGQFFSW